MTGRRSDPRPARSRARLLDAATALLRSGGVAPRVLRLELEEFSHLFESPTQSSGVVRLRATLLADNLPPGERWAQRLRDAETGAAPANWALGVSDSHFPALRRHRSNSTHAHTRWERFSCRAQHGP